MHVLISWPGKDIIEVPFSSVETWVSGSALLSSAGTELVHFILRYQRLPHTRR